MVLYFFIEFPIKLNRFLLSGEYVRAFRQIPHDPLVTLCLGLQYVQLACQRYPRSRHSCVVQVKEIENNIWCKKDACHKENNLSLRLESNT